MPDDAEDTLMSELSRLVTNNHVLMKPLRSGERA
jgi:hypothetical protein